MASSHSNSGASERRQGDRRQQQVPIDFPDRRQGDRRSGADRRQHPRD
ncbi:MAG: hypothetical protein KDE15_02610 [Erythrobacter sp.]|nr:hypothetical protein [Erythrobacter sp.]